jgi:hypothetical protein
MSSSVEAWLVDAMLERQEVPANDGLQAAVSCSSLGLALSDTIRMKGSHNFIGAMELMQSGPRVLQAAARYAGRS